YSVWFTARCALDKNLSTPPLGRNMDLRSFVSTANSALYTATNYFSIPSGATSKEIRISGVKCIGTGIVCFLVAMVIMFVGGIEHGAGVSLLPNLMGYGFILVGGYRLVFGK